MKKKVVILGGGVAGMSAAHELAERGFQVHVYEARPVPGGKARSIPVEGSSKDGRKELPGEHGLRFFPGFYQHVIDTMKRIPYQNNPNGVFDNLVGTTRTSITHFDRAPINLPVIAPSTIDDFKAAIEVFVQVISNKTGLEEKDWILFAEKLWQIITSSKERRIGEYEKISWWEYVEAENRSTDYKNLLAKGLTESLVASKAKLASTKTVGDIFLQLFFDIVASGKSADRVLNGPTSEVWIQPWLRHLQNLGVDYHIDSLVRSLNYDKETRLIQSVTVKDQRTNEEYQVKGDYYIAAIPIEVMAKLIRISHLDQYEATFNNIITLSQNVAWMNGIQFYLKEDIEIINGHALYVSTPWALTSISQKQFWPNVDLSEYGDGQVKGVLSVVISDWGPFLKPQSQATQAADVDEETSKGILCNKYARDCDRDEIAQEVWAQLKKSLNIDGKEVIKDENLHSWFIDPDIVNVDQELFHWIGSKGEVSLDQIKEYLRKDRGVHDEHVANVLLRTLVDLDFVEEIVEDRDEKIRARFQLTSNVNLEPLLVNLVNTWQIRPEAYTRIPNLFLASDYVRTNTDLATMEGANEAARRAVNAIISVSGSNAPLCKIWDLKEPEIFAPWRQRDSIRYQQGLPWDGKLF
ncbi:MAG: FAD-dependent oxidoreductase [Chroococcidiopsidaceae cyanobacterium CP_BM_ER_R8_30]|nr:FAD-dependent oxidoreductase [Chroococcidiopsidaceae cyanobacterium CP_BM_ER_R8_30]